MSSYTVIRQGDTDSAYKIECVVDNLSDLSGLPLDWLPGSKCLVLEDSSTWVLNNNKKWTHWSSQSSSSGCSKDELDKFIAEAVKQSNLYTDEKISNLKLFDIILVDSLPITDIKSHTIYLVPVTFTTSNNVYNEYIYINNNWELIGNTSFNFDNYYTKAEVEEYLKNNQYVLPIASASTLGGVKIDNNSVLQISSDGTLSIDSQNPLFEDIVNNAIDPISEDAIGKLF